VAGRTLRLRYTLFDIFFANIFALHDSLPFLVKVLGLECPTMVTMRMGTALDYINTGVEKCKERIGGA
jgi:hypothetical protein